MLNSEQTGFVAQINLASKALPTVITDVLDPSKIEAGELMISRVAFSPRVLLQGLCAMMHTQADLQGITLHLDVPDDLPAALEGDAARLNQILTILLSNAIKFTARGGVTLCVPLLESTPAEVKLSFTVRDTGIGIDPAAQTRLFTPFIRGDESITRRYGCTGLGLSIIMRHAVGARVRAGVIDAAPRPANGSAAWPEIDGIDMDAARRRLCDEPRCSARCCSGCGRKFRDPQMGGYPGKIAGERLWNGGDHVRLRNHHGNAGKVSDSAIVYPDFKYAELVRT